MGAAAVAAVQAVDRRFNPEALDNLLALGLAGAVVSRPAHLAGDPPHHLAVVADDPGRRRSRPA
jgi:hypothetical protein